MKPGMGKKYKKTLDEAKVLKPTKIIYSKANGEEKEYDIK